RRHRSRAAGDRRRAGRRAQELRARLMFAEDKEKGGPGSAVTRPIPSPEALDGFLEVLGDAEGDLLRRLDLDGLAGRRVAAHACRTIAHLKDTEARDADLVALLEVLHDQTDEVVEAAGRVLLRHAGLLGQLGRDLRERDSRSGGFGSHCGGVPYVFGFHQRLPDAPGQRWRVQNYPRIAGPQAPKARKMSISGAFSAI